MKRAAIIVLAIATLVLIVSPSASPFASTQTKSAVTGPSVVTPLYGRGDLTGPYTSPTGGGTGGGGTDQGDADGLSGLKVKPGALNVGDMPTRVAITLMMWWRYMVLVR